MRLSFAIPVLLLAGCQVSKDADNGTITAEFNQDVADGAARHGAEGAEPADA
jgi:hypothetical protein